MSFHWQTDDKADWEKPAPPPSSPPKWRFGPLSLLIVGLVALAAVTIRQQVNNHIEAVSETLRAEVTAAFWLSRGAAARQDEELYLTLLSGRDQAWIESQMTLLAANQIGGRAMWQMPAADDPEIMGIALSPDLNTATITVRQPLLTILPDGRSRTIQVYQIDIFRRGQDHWLLSPPDTAFWELTERSRGRYLTLSYPQRDRATAERLASDLESDIALLCAEMAVCHNLHLDVTLSPDLHSLSNQVDFASRLQTGPQLLLPSPTLVGVPIDEGGYQALRRAYASRVVGTAINHLVAYTCCAYPSLYLALLDMPLHALGLRPGGLTADDYAQMLEADLNLSQLLGNLRAAWLLSPDDEANADFSPAYMQAFVTFLLMSQENSSYLEQLQRLAHTDSFPAWAAYNSENNLDRFIISQGGAWFRFLSGQAQLVQPAPPIPLPGNSVALMCAGLRGQIAYEYNLAQNEIIQTQEMRAFGGYQILATMPDGQGVIIPGLSGYNADGFPLIEVASWRGGQSQRLYLNHDASFYALAQYDPTGQYLALLFITREPNAFPVAVLLNLAECQVDGCAAVELAGWPIWSPDGQRTLLFDLRGQKTWLGDALGQNARLTPPEENSGFFLSTAWLDDNSYAYALSNAGNSSTIYSYSLVTGETELLAQAADYIKLLPASTAPAASVPANNDIIYMVTVPQQSPRLVFAANVGTMFNSSQPTAVFSFDLNTRALKLLYYENITSTPYPPFQISSDGRWLTILTYQRLDDPISQLLLYDLTDVTKGSRVIARGDYVAYDWSADGQWLAVYNDRRLYALAPGYGYERLYTPGQGECHEVVWQR